MNSTEKQTGYVMYGGAFDIKQQVRLKRENNRLFLDRAQEFV